MKKTNCDSNDYTNRIMKNTLRLGLWTGAWLLTTALVVFGSKFIWDFNTWPTIVAVLMNLGVGFGMIIANKQHLKGLDELQQKIQLEAMALTLGIGLIIGLSYGLLEDIRLISFEPEISHLIILMGLTYLFSVIAGQRRYR